MTAKEYLNRYRTLNSYIDCKLEEVAHLRDLATRLTPTKMFDHNGNTTDKVGRTVAKIVDLEREIDREVDELVEMRKEIEETISKIEDERFKTLLTMRYINGYKWEKIALEMHYSYSSITYYLHPRALREVEKHMK